MNNKEIEIWKTIKEFPEFEVSNLGSIRNISTKRLCKVTKEAGCIRVYVHSKNIGKTISILVKKAVIKAFGNTKLEYPEYLYKINNKDGNIENCHIDNVEYAIRSTAYKAVNNRTLEVLYSYNTRLKRNKFTDFKIIESKYNSVDYLGQFDYKKRKGDEYTITRLSKNKNELIGIEEPIIVENNPITVLNKKSSLLNRILDFFRNITTIR